MDRLRRSDGTAGQMDYKREDQTPPTSKGVVRQQQVNNPLPGITHFIQKVCILLQKCVYFYKKYVHYYKTYLYYYKNWMHFS